MAFSVSFPQAPENVRLETGYVRELTKVINNIMRGKTNNRGQVTLEANQASTVVNDVNVGGESIILFEPTTANAASEIYNGASMYVSSKGKQTFTITHSNSAQTDRTFWYAVIG